LACDTFFITDAWRSHVQRDGGFAYVVDVSFCAALKERTHLPPGNMEGGSERATSDKTGFGSPPKFKLGVVLALGEEPIFQQVVSRGASK
jgi:hypothetical protein